MAATQTTQSPVRASRNATFGIIALEFVVSQSLQVLSARFASIEKGFVQGISIYCTYMYVNTMSAAIYNYKHKDLGIR